MFLLVSLGLSECSVSRYAVCSPVMYVRTARFPLSGSLGGFEGSSGQSTIFSSFNRFSLPLLTQLGAEGLAAHYLAVFCGRMLCDHSLNSFDTFVCQNTDIPIGGRVVCAFGPTNAGQAG
jgi:hypothetical protein